MRVLVTGHHGYIGTVLVPLARQAGHDVVGLDSDLFEPCVFGEAPAEVESIARTYATSRPPISTASTPSCTSPRSATTPSAISIRRRPTTSTDRVGAAGREGQAGRRCAVHVLLVVQPVRQADTEDALDETAGFTPVTAYGESKVLAEQDIAPLADDDFSPTLPAQRDGVRRLAAPALRRRRQQPRRRRRTRPASRAPERRHAVAPARPHRGHLARRPGRARGAARADPRRGLQRRRDEENYKIREVAEIVARGRRQRRRVRARRRRARQALLSRRLLEARPRPSRRRAAVDGQAWRRAARARLRRLGHDVRGLHGRARPADQARPRAAGSRQARRRAALDGHRRG